VYVCVCGACAIGVLYVGGALMGVCYRGGYGSVLWVRTMVYVWGRSGTHERCAFYPMKLRKGDKKL
jgi:hypothetical protein